jgi:16S rRNA (guanine527-N7)-methyltransferase
VTRRLAEVAGRHALGPVQREQLGALLAALAEDEHAPSSVRDPLQALDVHLADSLIALEVEAVRRARRIADIGSGAGFPGLPLAVALPRSGVALVEAAARKCAFMRHVVRCARVENAEVVHCRVEEWRAGLGAFEVVLARALAPQAVVLEYAAPLLARDGLVLDWRGTHDASAEEGARAAAAVLGLERAAVLEVKPFRDSHGRHLHLYLKVRDTPERFPRRPGMARKRPLGTTAPARVARGGDASDRAGR